MSSDELGPDGSYETGDTVPHTGWWRDQHGVVTRHRRGMEFPPCIGREDEHAVRRLIKVAATA